MECAGEQVRRGQIRRRSLNESSSCNPAGCCAGPVYIPPGFQSGPGQIGVLHSDWPSIRDAVDAVGAGRSEDASLKHTWVTCWFQAAVLEAANSYWPLTSAGSLSWNQHEPNFYWLMVQAGSRGQPRGMLNSDWRGGQAASLYVDEDVTALEACERRLEAAYFLKVQGRSGHQGVEQEEAWGQGPS